MTEETEALKKRIEELEREVFVPGLWKCSKCNFELIQKTLCATTGNVGMHTDRNGGQCPNCNSNLWKVTYKALSDNQEDYIRKHVHHMHPVVRVAVMITDGNKVLFEWNEKKTFLTLPNKEVTMGKTWKSVSKDILNDYNYKCNVRLAFRNYTQDIDMKSDDVFDNDHFITFVIRATVDEVEHKDLPKDKSFKFLDSGWEIEDLPYSDFVDNSSFIMHS